MSLDESLARPVISASGQPPRGVGGRVAPALVSATAGGALSLAFDPVGTALVGPVAIAAFVATVALTAQTARRGALLGYLFGLTFLSVHLRWLVALIAAGAWAAVVSIEALWFAGVGALIPLLRSLPAWPLLVAIDMLALAGLAAAEMRALG